MKNYIIFYLVVILYVIVILQYNLFIQDLLSVDNKNIQLIHTLENDYLLYDIKKVEYLIIFRIKTLNDYNNNLEIVRNNVINLINKSIIIIDINVNINNDDRKSRLLFIYLNGIL